MAKLRASDGALLATFPVGSTPEGILFDGSNIWVANLLSDTVTKLRASDGAPLGTFSAGDGGRDLAFDGDNIWVADYYADSVHVWVANVGENTVMRLRLSDGAIQRTYRAESGSQFVLFDGASIWVSNFYRNTVDKISRPAEQDGATP